MLKTVDEVVLAFGGTAEFARTFGATMPQVSRAKAQNKIPLRIRLPLHMEAERRKIAISPTLLGLEAA